MKLKNFDLKKKVFIIAEVGNNNEGNFNIAKKLVSRNAKPRTILNSINHEGRLG